MCNCKDFFEVSKGFIAYRNFHHDLAGMVNGTEISYNGSKVVRGRLEVDKGSLLSGTETTGRVWVSAGAFVPVKRSPLDGKWYYHLDDLPRTLYDNYVAL